MRKLAACSALCMIVILNAATKARADDQQQAMFYMTETRKSKNSFEAHWNKVGILVPTWYGVDDVGLVSGQPDPAILSLAHAHHIPVMPILSNLDRPKLHALLANREAQDAMNASLVSEGERNGYAGFQLDFESIVWTDRDALTALVRRAATALHAHKLLLSMAVTPNAPGHPGAGEFSRWMWQYWRGAFDIAAIGAATDSVCLMTYDQHTRWTTPGPVGGWRWTNQQLDYAVARMPRARLLLGIPLYGYHWYTGNPVRPDGTEAANIVGDYFDADESIPLARELGIKPDWDAEEHESFYRFTQDDLREYVAVPDARSFADRVALARRSGLKGYCAWELGSEDPAIWTQIPDQHR